MKKAKSNDSSPQNHLKSLKRKTSLMPTYNNKSSTLSNRYQHSIIVIYNNRIRLFSSIEIKPDCSFIDLSLNFLTNFVGFPSSLMNLTTLILDDNQIRSFYGIQSSNLSFPKLRFISMKKSPISKCFYFKIMCIIIFGGQVHTINGEKITENQRQTATKLRKTVLPNLVQGKIISNINPLRFSDPLPEKKQIDHSIDHNDRKSSPNAKLRSRKMSPTKNCKKVEPSVGCLVNMISQIPTKKIEKALQKEISLGEKNDSKRSLLKAVIEMKSIINQVKSKFNENEEAEKQNDADILNVNSLQEKEQKLTVDEINKNDVVDEKENKNKVFSSNVDDEKENKNKVFSSIVDDENENRNKVFSSNVENKPNEISIPSSVTKIELSKQMNENENVSPIIHIQNQQNNKVDLFDFSSFNIIDKADINNDAEMVFDYPEACKFLILDDL